MIFGGTGAGQRYERPHNVSRKGTAASPSQSGMPRLLEWSRVTFTVGSGAKVETLIAYSAESAREGWDCCGLLYVYKAVPCAVSCSVQCRPLLWALVALAVAPPAPWAAAQLDVGAWQQLGRLGRR